ncbi:MAG: hypothetical protein WCY77_03275 [Weeksellaceae bacterium]
MFDDLKQYINNRINYTKLEILDSLSNMISVSVFGILMAMASMLVLFIASLAFGFLLGDWFDNMGLGFLALTLFYIVLLIVAFVFRKKIILRITDKAIEVAADSMDKSDD